MHRASLLVGLSYVYCLVLATRLRAAGDHVTYQCSGKVLHTGVPRLDEASIDDLNALQASFTVTSVDIVQARCPSARLSFRDTNDLKAYIERINEVNPLLRAVSEINPSALYIAASLDAERAAGRLRG